MAKFSKRPTKSQAKKIRSIRAKNYSASYEKRLIRGVMQGKERQQARGHKPKEHVARKEREREENEGITVREAQSIQNWYDTKFNPGGHKNIPTEEDVIDFARSEGYERFQVYRDTWNKARSTYKAEIRAGKWESRGLQFLLSLVDMARVRPQGDVQWLYYH